MIKQLASLDEQYRAGPLAASDTSVARTGPPVKEALMTVSLALSLSVSLNKCRSNGADVMDQDAGIVSN